MSRSLEEPDSNWDAEWQDSPPWTYCEICDAKYVRGDIVTYIGSIGSDVGFVCCYCETYQDCTDWYIESQEPDPDRYRDEEWDRKMDEIYEDHLAMSADLDWPKAL